MKFSLSWLKTHLDTNLPADEIAEHLTFLGLELEELVDSAANLRNIKVAEIVKAKQHPDADRLKVCQIYDGNEEIELVCGAPNAREGIKVALAYPGQYIPKLDITLKKSKIRGVASNGMLCSAAELGLGDDASGIIELDDDAVIGNSIVEELAISDPVFDIAITPNRGDCLGVRGIARDLAAANIGKMRELEKLDLPSDTIRSPIKVQLADSYLCPYYIGCYISDVNNMESPKWLQERLKSIGLAPISFLVDITNFFAFDLGRPLHVYDADKIGEDIVLRKASDWEVFKALDGNDYHLSAGMPAIADENEIIALGGVIGGANSSCEMGTKNIWLECALFNPEEVAKAGRKLAINSDARYRFERGLDPAVMKKYISRAVAMIIDNCGGQNSELVIAGEMSKNRNAIELPKEFISNYSGVNIEPDEIIAILENLGFNAFHAGNDLMVDVPSWRSDVSLPVDLVEEILRIKGYDDIAKTPINIKILPATKSNNSDDDINNQKYLQKRYRNNIQAAKEILVAYGAREIYSWAFCSRQEAGFYIDNISSKFEIINPISSELVIMRPSLIAGLLRAAATNYARSYTDFALFETGEQFIHDIATDDNAGDESSMQQNAVSGLLVGEYIAKHAQGLARKWDFYDAKTIAFDILTSWGVDVSRLIMDSSNPAKYYHPGKSATIRLGKNILGRVGVLHPNLYSDIKGLNEPIAFELYPESIAVSKKASKNLAKPFIVSEFPAVKRDFAFIVPNDVTNAEIESAIKSVNRELISSIRLFDEYSGKNMEPGYKSLAYKVVLQAIDKTLSEDIINNICDNIIAAVHKLGAKLRG